METIKEAAVSLINEQIKLKEMMDAYYDVTSIYQNEVIGFRHGGFTKSDLGISTCTYIAEKYDADIAFINTTSLRTEITVSKITNGLRK